MATRPAIKNLPCYIQHVDSGLFVHPHHGQAVDGCELVLWPGADESRLVFEFTGGAKAGKLIHRQTKLIIGYSTAQGETTVPNDTAVVLKRDSSGGYLFQLDGDSCLNLVGTDSFVHPFVGAAKKGTKLVLYQGGGEKRLQFQLFPAPGFY